MSSRQKIIEIIKKNKALKHEEFEATCYEDLSTKVSDFFLEVGKIKIKYFEVFPVNHTGMCNALVSYER